LIKRLASAPVFRVALFVAAAMTLLLELHAATAGGDFSGVRIFSDELTCKGAPLAIQVLGSGGPIASDGRASTGYIVWIDGRSRIMVDAGGGTFLRFGEAGARTKDLDVLAISHFHADHAADLPAILWSGLLSGRRESLTIIGPSGNGNHADTSSFLHSLFDRSDGAFGTVSPVETDVTTVDVDKSDVTSVYKKDDLEVLALGVPHTVIPTLAFRINKGERSIAFGGDQNGKNPSFVDFVKGVDILVMHLAISEIAGQAAGGQIFLADVHATPSTVGRIAAAAKPRTLVLSHLIGSERSHPQAASYSLYDLESNVDVVREYYSGSLVVAEDLLCLPVK
jgi:ribonuclease BN (tRNA processing enzyme)